jgi:hypothetical protein
MIHVNKFRYHAPLASRTTLLKIFFLSSSNLTDPALIQLQYIGSANNLHHLNDGFIILLCSYIIDREYSIERDLALLFVVCLIEYTAFSTNHQLSCVSLSLSFLCVACNAFLPLVI